MTYDTDDELEHLRLKRQRYSERMSSSHEATPAIKMIIGDWYVDELGVRTREIHGARIALRC